MNVEGSISSEPEPGISFWKRNIKIVPGRPSPSKCSGVNRPRKSRMCSFENYEHSVKDAWEVGDDEFCIISDIKIFKKIAQSTALNVINNHRCSGNGDSPLVSLSTSRSCEVLDKTWTVLEKKEQVGAQQSLVSTINVHSVSLSKNASLHQVPTLHFTYRPKQCPGNVDSQVCKVKSKFVSQFQNNPDCSASKLQRFQEVLDDPLLDLEKIKRLSWSGIPAKFRAVAWRFLSGYLPTKLERRELVLERNRLEYWKLVKLCFGKDEDDTHRDTYKQIQKDVPRMSPLIGLFRQKTVQEMFERILFVWAVRHPATGYVQGINDLVTPFFVVFLQAVIPPSENLTDFEVSSLRKEQRDMIEADSFWCFSKFLDGFQDNYIFAEEGIQHKVNHLKDLIHRIDGPLHRHLQENGVDYLQFSFRWMNNLLTRELPLHCTIRLWDTYLAESEEFPCFQLYVFASFLLHWRNQLLAEKDFQSLMLMLQNLPTENWSDSEIGLLVAEAYRLKFVFADAPNHLNLSTQV